MMSMMRKKRRDTHMKNKNKKKELCAILAQGNDQGANFGFKKKKMKCD